MAALGRLGEWTGTKEMPTTLVHSIEAPDAVLTCAMKL